MGKQNTQNESHSNSDNKGAQDIKTNHTKAALWILAVVLGAAWILPEVAEHWNDWWMKLIVLSFGAALSYRIYALFREGAKWKHSHSFWVAISIAVLYFALCAYAYSGGFMPAFLSNPMIRFVLPIILSALAIGAWYRALHSAPPPPQTQPTTRLTEEQKTRLRNMPPLVIPPGVMATIRPIQLPKIREGDRAQLLKNIVISANGFIDSVSGWRKTTQINAVTYDIKSGADANRFGKNADKMAAEIIVLSLKAWPKLDLKFIKPIVALRTSNNFAQNVADAEVCVVALKAKAEAEADTI